MSRSTCVICQKNKTALQCHGCGDASCKNCVQFIDEDHFAMISLLPDDLKNKTFCMNCYNQGVGEKIIHYAEMVEKAKDVDVFTTNQTKETRRIKRVESPLSVSECDDRDEALMKLAFLTADKGYDTIVDVEISSKKVGEGKSYKKMMWAARGVPVDPSIRK